MASAQSMEERRSSRTILTGGTTSCYYEYFHGDNGAGLGASHQTGWTGLVARALDLFARLTPDEVLRAASGVMADMTREQVAGS